MATLMLRDLDDDVVRTLQANATSHGRTVEEEAVAILTAATPARRNRTEWLAKARAVAALTPTDTSQTDSVELLREDRDR